MKDGTNRLDLDSVRGLQLNALFERTIRGTSHADGILSAQLEIEQVIKSIQEGTDGLGFGNQVSILGMDFVVHLRIQTGNCVKPTLVRYQDRSRLLLQVLDEDLSPNKRVFVSVSSHDHEETWSEEFFLSPTPRKTETKRGEESWRDT